MGNILSHIETFWKSLMKNTEANICLIGLDNAGKTTLLYKVKLDEDIDTIPTLGFNVEVLSYKKVTMTCYDIGGQDKFRDLWRHYYKNSDCVIYVVDANDTKRLKESKYTLKKVLSDDNLKDANLLIYANKQDLPNAKSASELADYFEINKLGNNRKIFIQPCVAKTGDGLFEGLEWLSKNIGKK